MGVFLHGPGSALEYYMYLNVLYPVNLTENIIFSYLQQIFMIYNQKMCLYKNQTLFFKSIIMTYFKQSTKFENIMDMDPETGKHLLLATNCGLCISS